MTKAEKLFEGSFVEMELTDALCDAGVPFERIGWDYYDNSIELYDVAVDYRLTAEARKILADAGFSVAFVNHVDKWETHYNLSQPEKEPWRVSYPHKRNDGDPTMWLETLEDKS